MHIHEEWRTIPEFPMYSVSSFGRIHNDRSKHFVATSRTPFGHVKVSLMSPQVQHRYTRSVAVLVGEAFVEAPEPLCDNILLLDGDLGHVAAINIVWRPRWYCWKYTRQLKTPQPLHYKNLPIRNLHNGIEYDSIISAGMTEGLLFEDIWDSTWMGKVVYPCHYRFEVIDRV